MVVMQRAFGKRGSESRPVTLVTVSQAGQKLLFCPSRDTGNRNTSLSQSCPAQHAEALKLLEAFWDPTSWKFCTTRLVNPTVSISKSLLESVPPFGRKYQPGSSTLYLSSLYFPSDSWYRSYFFFHEMMEALISLGIRSIRMQRNVLVSQWLFFMLLTNLFSMQLVNI